MYRYVGMKISVSEKSTTVHVHAVYIGAHVVIMFPCDSHNYN